jgi:serine/threonine-protein kinase
VPVPSVIPAATMSPGVGAPAGAFIQLHLAANPVDARILLDGAALPSNPFDGKSAKDGAVHRIQVEANGFLPQTRIVVFDKDVSLDVALSFRPKAADRAGMKPDPYK